MSHLSKYRNRKIGCLIVAMLCISMAPHLFWHIGRKSLALKAICINALYPMHYYGADVHKIHQNALVFCPFCAGVLSVGSYTAAVFLTGVLGVKQLAPKNYKEAVSNIIFSCYSPRGPPSVKEDG